MTVNRDIFGPKKGLLNHIRWAWAWVFEGAKFWVEIRWQKLKRKMWKPKKYQCEWCGYTLEAPCKSKVQAGRCEFY